MMKAVQSILVAGPGTQALLTAFALKKLNAAAEILLLRDTGGPDDTPACGESVPPLYFQYLSTVLGVPAADLHALGQPVWSLGTKYLLGARESFYQSYDASYGSRPDGLGIDPGYLAAADGLSAATLATALMEAGKLFPRDGSRAARPLEHLTGLNFRSGALQALLVRACQASGVEMVEGSLQCVNRGPEGIAGLTLDDGQELHADLYLDLTGPAATLLGDEAAFLENDPSCGCRRALTLLRRRGSDPVRPYVTVTGVEHGFQWRVEHADAVGLGLAWSSAHADEAWAMSALRVKPTDLLAAPVLHEWRPGRRAEAWRGNAIALGNASGFVEPLAVLGSGILILQIDRLRRFLHETGNHPGPETRRLYNLLHARTWDEMRDFTTLHYRHGAIAGSAFWNQAGQADLGDHTELLAMFQSLGPTLQLAHCLPAAPGVIGIDGWLAALIGLGVPFPAREIPASSRVQWQAFTGANRQRARQAIDLETCLAAVRKSHATRVVEDTSY